MEENKQKRIEQIDERIKDLKAHASMWGKAGGHGGKMFMQAFNEIEELELEKEDLENGTNKLKIHKIEKELRYLNAIKHSINIFKRISCNHEIKKLEEELQTLKK